MTRTRLPWMKFFPSAWLSDSALGRCSPATRGCWMDLLMVMADGDRSGRLTGTVAELARICRCSPDEMAAALLELRSAGVAEVSGLPETVTNVTVSSVTLPSHVTLGHGLVTVENRRMAREHKSRHGSALRMGKMRAKRSCYAESYGVEVRNQLNNPPAPPTKQSGLVTPSEPRQAGGRAGSEISELQPPAARQAGHGLVPEPPAPQPPDPDSAPQRAQATPEPPGFEARWQEVLLRFPAVERKAISRHAIRERSDAIGRPFDLLLAQVAEVCEDEESGRVKIAHSPLALASARLRDGRGLKNGTLGKVRLALGLALPDTQPRNRDPEPLAASIAPSGPPPSKRQLQAALERLERAGQTAAAEQIRRMLEQHQESLK